LAVTITLQKALENYRQERRRIVGGAYPCVACNCGFCDVVRAGDLLYERATAEVALRRWRPRIDRRPRA